MWIYAAYVLICICPCHLNIRENLRRWSMRRERIFEIRRPPDLTFRDNNVRTDNWTFLRAFGFNNSISFWDPAKEYSSIYKSHEWTIIDIYLFYISLREEGKIESWSLSMVRASSIIQLIIIHSVNICVSILSFTSIMC